MTNQKIENAIQNELYVFIDNSFLYIEGYKYIKKEILKGNTQKKPQIDYQKLKKYIGEHGAIKRIVLVGSELAGNLITTCQTNGIEVFTLPKHPDIKSGTRREKGVDLKVGWEIAKTIFTNKDSIQNKKIIVCTGDKDFASIIPDIHTSNWSLELWLWNGSYSPKFADQIKTFGNIKAIDKDWKKFINLVTVKKVTTKTSNKST